MSSASATDSATESNEEMLSFARRIALAKLTTRAHSEAELRSALAKKNVSAKIIDELIARFIEVGLIDDRSFAEQWVSSRHQHKQLSKAKLRQELKTKGVSDDDISVALETIGYEDECSAATRIAEKKVRSMASLPKPVQLRRLAGMLTRRGFSAGVVSEVTRALLDDVGFEVD